LPISTIDDLPHHLPLSLPFTPHPNPLEHSGPHLDIGPVLRRPSPLQSIRSDTGIWSTLFGVLPVPTSFPSS
jgi:hypothetical protein